MYHFNMLGMVRATLSPDGSYSFFRVGRRIPPFL